MGFVKTEHHSCSWIIWFHRSWNQVGLKKLQPVYHVYSHLARSVLGISIFMSNSIANFKYRRTNINKLHDPRTYDDPDWSKSSHNAGSVRVPRCSSGSICNCLGHLPCTSTQRLFHRGFHSFHKACSHRHCDSSLLWLQSPSLQATTYWPNLSYSRVHKASQDNHTLFLYTYRTLNCEFWLSFLCF